MKYYLDNLFKHGGHCTPRYGGTHEIYRCKYELNFVKLLNVLQFVNDGWEKTLMDVAPTGSSDHLWFIIQNLD